MFAPLENANMAYASAGGLGNKGMFANTRKRNRPIKVPDEILSLTKENNETDHGMFAFRKFDTGSWMDFCWNKNPTAAIISKIIAILFSFTLLN